MKKDTLLNAIIITLLIIMGVSIVIAAFMLGEVRGFLAIGFMSFIYILIILLMKMKNDYGSYILRHYLRPLR